MLLQLFSQSLQHGICMIGKAPCERASSVQLDTPGCSSKLLGKTNISKKALKTQLHRVWVQSYCSGRIAKDLSAKLKELRAKIAWLRRGT
mmetsp:Transcript_39929/g.46513  ORF Transcript_39929/g.46513 Transcript_39929/m.46513 type:complete len:90 (+) Transcript_39929:135-404(+)